MRVLLFAVADDSLIDADRNALSLINILVDYAVSAFPVAIPRLTVVGIYERAVEEPNIVATRLRVTLNGQEVLDVPWASDFQLRQKLQSRATLQSIPIFGPGVLRFSVMLGDEELGYWNVNVLSLGPKVDLLNATQDVKAAPRVASDA